MLSPIKIAVLKFMAERKTVDLRKISEPMRQQIIDLAMMDKPLVDVDADQVFLTAHGDVALDQLHRLGQSSGGT